MILCKDDLYCRLIFYPRPQVVCAVF